MLTHGSSYGGWVRDVPWWTVVSSSAAPVLLIGGWTVAAAIQTAGFDQVAGTISELASGAVTDPWVMNWALAGVGACHLVTALGLRPARPAGRVGLAIGGAAMLVVAAHPLPAAGTSTGHAVSATVAFVALGAWPPLAARRGRQQAWGLRPVVCAAAAVALLGLVGAFAVELGGPRAGLAERVAAGAQALWPLAVVASARLSRWRNRSAG